MKDDNGIKEILDDLYLIEDDLKSLRTMIEKSVMQRIPWFERKVAGIVQAVKELTRE